MLKQLIDIADSTLVNLASRLGTSRDKATYNQFAWHVPKSIYELNNLYASDSIARKIINRPVQDMFRQGYYFTGLAGEELQAFSAELVRLDLDSHLKTATRYARLHGLAYILLSTNDNANMSQPINLARGLSHITALSIEQLHESNEVLPASQAGGHYDRPKYYYLQMSGQRTLNIHHSRVLVLKWEDGKSVLQSIYDELLRFASVNASVASLVHEAKVDVVHIPELGAQIARDTDALVKRFNLVGLLKSNNGTLMLDKEEDYESKSYTFGGLTDLMREFAIQTAGAADIPYTVLFGQLPTGLNATGKHDLINYYDVVASYQHFYLQPIMQHLISIVAGYIIPNRSPVLVFNPLWQIDEKVRSEVEKNHAERDMQYLQAGIITEAQIAKQLVEEGTYTVIDDAHIALLERLAEPNLMLGGDDGAQN